MAWRIEQAVIRGEIDNTVEGLTTGTIWLAGCDAPLQLRLEGDCWRDLSGSRLRFENPAPVPCSETTGLAVNQAGVVGDMTASRKCRVPLVDDDEMSGLHLASKPIPCEWHNTLYLEWFSEFNGRVVIEAVDFILTISEHQWQLDEDAEQAQKLANLNAMRDFMALVIQRSDDEALGSEPVGELDEFAWEERLKESDRLTDAYQEVLEKYLDDEDSESKEAFVMGWDGLLEALAERDEAEMDGDSGDFEDDGDELEGACCGFPDFDDGLDDGESGYHADGTPFDDEDSHPLQLRSRDLALQAMEIVESGDGPGSPSYELVSSLLQVTGKLAGALNGQGGGYHPETGFVLAVLKRCLNWLNEALHACQELHAASSAPKHRLRFKQLHQGILQIRSGIVELRMKIRKS